MKKIWLLIVMLCVLMTAASCLETGDDILTFTVSFETDGGTVIPDQEVPNGGKVTRPDDPTREGYLFSGVWLHGSNEWNFAIDIVTDDLILTAVWIEVSTTPTNISMTNEVFSSNITWRQVDAADQTFTVSIKPQTSSVFTVIEGSIDIVASELDTVTFTPDVLPQGGYHVVRVASGTETTDSALVLFGGAGSVGNPYRVSKVTDVLIMLEDEAYANQHYLQVADVLTTLTNPLDITNARKVVFSGVYDGGNKSLSFGGNGGLFHEISATGVVKNLVIEATTQLSAAESNLYPIGAVADVNHGRIENISSRANVNNARYQGEVPVFTGVVDTADQTAGAGGIVGINKETGVISNVTVGGAGAVKAGRGIGGVAAYNHGLIEQALVTATLPAGNQANTARSSNVYSYGGGVAGFNYGTIRESVVSGRVFAQSAYAVIGDGNENKQVAFGGIAGYNEGLITESSFARSMTLKEFIDKSRAGELDDSANNLGVASIHGDIHIGGIAGINAGQITHNYVGGALIGGRDFVGGVAGLTLGSGYISNTYVFAEVAIKDAGGAKITVPNDKTTATTYEIAPDGFDPLTVVYKPLLNSVTGNTWVPGNVEPPMLPDFEAADLAKVGDKFAETGVLLWQQGLVTGVNIVMDAIVLPFGATETIEYQVSPANAPDTFTIWTSDDDTVVEIIGEGVIQGVGAGVAVVTVTTRDGGHTDTITVTVEDYIHVDSVTVTSDQFDLPAPNDTGDRPEVTIGTVITFDVEILPEDARYQGYTLSSSNSRAVVDGATVTFVLGSVVGNELGNVSITIHFEDTTVASLEYRFKTVEGVPEEVSIDEVIVTSSEFALPNANDSEDRPEIDIGTVITFDVEILPEDASNKNYTLVSSNSRAVVDGNTVTFVLGATSPQTGNVSITIHFEDIAAPSLEYRFLTVSVPTDEVIVTALEITLPNANDSGDRPEIEVGTTITIVIDFIPENATYQNYTITVSNSRAIVDGNTVTFVLGSVVGNELGNVSIRITFEDTTIGIDGLLEYRFLTVMPPEEND